MDHGPYPWATQDASATPRTRGAPPPAPAGGCRRAPWNSHEAMLPGAAAPPPQRKLAIHSGRGGKSSTPTKPRRPRWPSRGGRGRGRGQTAASAGAGPRGGAAARAGGGAAVGPVRLPEVEAVAGARRRRFIT